MRSRAWIAVSAIVLGCGSPASSGDTDSVGGTGSETRGSTRGTPPAATTSSSSGGTEGSSETGDGAGDEDSSVGGETDGFPANEHTFDTLMIPPAPPFEVGPRDVLVATCRAEPIADVEELRNALAMAEDGACVRVADGIYDIGSVNVGASGVTLAAQNVDQVTFNGGTQLVLAGNEIVVEGIEFLDGDGRQGNDSAGIVVEGHDVHLSRLVFQSWGSQTPEEVSFLIRVSQFAGGLQVSDSVFTDQYGIAMIQPQEPGGELGAEKGMWIHHNQWIDNPPRPWGNGGEVIQLGTAWAYGPAQPGPKGYDDDVDMVFEYNSMVRHDQEGEILSLKSSRNLLQFNWFDDCTVGAIVIRMGLRNLVYGNWFTGGMQRAVRISGENNVVAYNYFEGATNGAISLHRRNYREDPAPYLVDHYWAASNNWIAHNILQGYEHLADQARSGNFVDGDFPLGNVFEGNLLLDVPETFYDEVWGRSDEDFWAENERTANTAFTGSDDVWTTPRVITVGSLDVTGRDLLWDAEALPPPAWWADVVQ